MTQITFDAAYNVLLIHVPEIPEADEYLFWAKLFLHQEALTIIEELEGADRHQTRFSYGSSTFNMNFEHYTDSIWIAPEGTESEEQLVNLSKYLLTSFQ
ncbi:DUF3630 family protein [Pseudoalteromonas sp. MMG012]|uniref:DUF3630 family protein n=1 Tax=Pseudoalteromonas sp. MMG012 TaxID=2822686 RepID=UPI001B39FEA4|nr:DUF3630 family protein [Pseudoalteromonas sp. MMG012]MBQ4849326.1 DUF3630 family protein [Pseudoalteromonas sp. MMG012]